MTSRHRPPPPLRGRASGLDVAGGSPAETPRPEGRGVSLQGNESKLDGDPLLPSPFEGEEESAAMSATKPNAALFSGIHWQENEQPEIPPPPERGRMGGGQDLRSRLHPALADMAAEIRTTHAVRLGLRQIKGFREDDAQALMQARRNGYDSVRDLWLRAGLARGQIERLADGDAFRSLGLDRRDALWAARGLGGGNERDRLPLFDAAAHGDIAQEPDFPLPPMPIGEHVVNDYRYLHLSLKAHPLSFLRAALAARHILSNAALRTTPSGRRVSVAGLVIIRQRPGTAKGVIFMTLEDETDIANAIVWPKTFERFRPIVLGARLVAVSGRVQSESGVIHVVADALEDLTPMLATLSEDAGDLSALARGDEVRRPGVDHRAKVDMRHPRLVRFFAENPDLARDLAKLSAAAGKAMPRGRNFH